MQKINTWDRVIIVSWKQKWTVSVVLSVKKRDPDDGNLLLVDWVNIVKKHSKQDWIIEKEMFIHASNVMIYDESSSNWSKVWIRFTKKWKKERFLKTSWKSL